MIRVEEITLPQGSSLVNEQCADINLIIGSNNSGKTTFLNGLYSDVKSLHSHYPNGSRIQGIKMSAEKTDKNMQQIFPRLQNASGGFCNLSEISENLFLGETKDNSIFWNHDVYNALVDPNKKKFEFKFSYGSYEKLNPEYALFVFLTRILINFEECTNRLNCKFDTVINDLSQTPDNDFIFHLFKNRKIFSIIQKNIKDVYGLEIDFDNLNQGHKPLRIILRKVNSKITDPFKLNYEWKSKTIPLDSIGHGIRSYLKLVFTLLHPANQIILIDEPEMFIHPPQRRTLGKLISFLASKENKQLFIATHDAEFMRGVLSTSNNVKIFRLINENYKYSHHSIASQDILSLIKKQSSNILNERILNSLFYKTTVLCENENDRVFYEEAMANYHWPKFHDINFVGFTGKSVSVGIYNKLKQLNIKPVLILDIDYLVVGNFPDIQDTKLKEKYDALKAKFLTLSFSKQNPDYIEFKKLGLKVLNRKKYRFLSKDAKELMSLFAKHQVYIVPVGELESWTGVEKNDLPSALTKIRNQKIAPLANFLTKISNLC
jgi:AAA15 family ATPase/GTPase